MQNIKKIEILETAKNLFYTKGFSNTSIQNIADNSQIAKATFYHYFKSKEDLLIQLIEILSENLLNKLQNDIDKQKNNAFEKLKYIFNSSLNWKIKNRALIVQYTASIYKDENILLRTKLNNRLIILLQPLFTAIIEQGKSENIFNIENPELTAETILMMMFGISEIISPLFLKTLSEKLDPEIIITKLRHFQQALYRILGLKQDSPDIYDFNKINIFLKGDDK